MLFFNVLKLYFVGNLIIRNVTQEDAGTYLCKVDSGNGEHTVKDVYLKLIGKITLLSTVSGQQ